MSGLSQLSLYWLSPLHLYFNTISVKWKFIQNVQELLTHGEVETGSILRRCKAYEKENILRKMVLKEMILSRVCHIEDGTVQTEIQSVCSQINRKMEKVLQRHRFCFKIYFVYTFKRETGEEMLKFCCRTIHITGKVIKICFFENSNLMSIKSEYYLNVLRMLSLTIIYQHSSSKALNKHIFKQSIREEKTDQSI